MNHWQTPRAWGVCHCPTACINLLRPQTLLTCSCTNSLCKSLIADVDCCNSRHSVSNEILTSQSQRNRTAFSPIISLRVSTPVTTGFCSVMNICRKPMDLNNRYARRKPLSLEMTYGWGLMKGVKSTIALRSSIERTLSSSFILSSIISGLKGLSAKSAKYSDCFSSSSGTPKVESRLGIRPTLCCNTLETCPREIDPSRSMPCDGFPVSLFVMGNPLTRVERRTSITSLTRMRGRRQINAVPLLVFARSPTQTLSVMPGCSSSICSSSSRTGAPFSLMCAS
mmetsp:Transcript_13801/g.50259  ORF Transcript_13801/g.50259 Transcript_13801/m.50259 type:complete len:282 (-) Transcript_13801:1766-2611(-)